MKTHKHVTFDFTQFIQNQNTNEANGFRRPQNNTLPIIRLEFSLHTINQSTNFTINNCLYKKKFEEEGEIVPIIQIISFNPDTNRRIHGVS
jgi:hypothetical protein